MVTEQKIDYNYLMQKEIDSLNCVPTLLLHSCCGPCSTAVLERLKKFFDITVVYYNPNIYPEQEYEKRKNEQKKVLFSQGIKFMDCDYKESEFLNFVCGLENQPEGGARCSKCFLLRLEKTAILAKDNEYKYFCTTLTVSPHKNAKIINNIGKQLQEKYNIKFLPSDFKKQNGYLRSIQISTEMDLYRQNYCGCRFSKKN